MVHEGDGTDAARLEGTHLRREVLEARDDEHGAHLSAAQRGGKPVVAEVVAHVVVEDVPGVRVRHR